MLKLTLNFPSNLPPVVKIHSAPLAAPSVFAVLQAIFSTACSRSVRRYLSVNVFGEKKKKLARNHDICGLGRRREARYQAGRRCVRGGDAGAPTGRKILDRSHNISRDVADATAGFCP